MLNFWLENLERSDTSYFRLLFLRLFDGEEKRWNEMEREEAKVLSYEATFTFADT